MNSYKAKREKSKMPETRATFIVRCDQLEKLKAYAWERRITLTESLELALDNFLDQQSNHGINQRSDCDMKGFVKDFWEESFKLLRQQNKEG